MILPPPDIRIIIEKLAAYVVKNGPSFEEKILEKEKHNARFSFLFPQDPYNQFYQHRLEEYRLVGPDRVDEMLSKSKYLQKKTDTYKEGGPERSGSDEYGAPKVPHEPEPFYFFLSPPIISALDYDVIKLTAQYVARNGRGFTTSIQQRESNNPQFDFLKPSHSFFPVFTTLVNQYSKIIIPTKSQTDCLSICLNSPSSILDRAMKRAEYTKFQRSKEAKDAEIEEKERTISASIDWNDFGIAETIEFSLNDKVVDLPRPLDPSTLTNMSLLQRRELWNGNAHPATSFSLPPLSPFADEEMEVEETQPPSHVQKNSAELFEAGQYRIRDNYIPKAAQLSAWPRSDMSEMCPICQQLVPKSQIEEHMRIEALDPKWKLQKERYLYKHRDSNIAISGEDVTRNLEAMKRVKTDLSNLADDDAQRLLTHSQSHSLSTTVQWDGRAESVPLVTKEAVSKAKPLLKAQISALQKSNDFSDSGIGPRSGGKS